jgi:hypothetical protein
MLKVSSSSTTDDNTSQMDEKKTCFDVRSAVVE